MFGFVLFYVIAVLFGADSGAATGQFAISAQATSGVLSHVTNSAGPAAECAELFVRSDSVQGIDVPASEPHQRHIVYDAAGKRFFVANGAMNRVDVLSPSSAAPLAPIDVPGASSF